jgi:hypothetical protein
MQEDLLNTISLGSFEPEAAGAEYPWGEDILSRGEWEEYFFLGSRNHFTVRV